MFAGGGEEIEWAMSSLFDAMGAMSSKYNDSPDTASRAFDETRDGFVIAGGVRHQTAMIWSRRLAKAQSGLCAWHWKALA